MTRLILTLAMALAPLACSAATAPKEPPPSTAWSRQFLLSPDGETAAGTLPGMGTEAMSDESGSVVFGAAADNDLLLIGGLSTGDKVVLGGRDLNGGNLPTGSRIEGESGNDPGLIWHGTLEAADMEGADASFLDGANVRARQLMLYDSDDGGDLHVSAYADGVYLHSDAAALPISGAPSANLTFHVGSLVVGGSSIAFGAGGTVLYPASIDTVAELFTIITNEGAGVATAAANAVDAANGFATFDAEVHALRTLTSLADRLPYYTGSGTAALATYTAAGRALDDDADTAAQRVTLGTNWYVKKIGMAPFGIGQLNPADATAYYLMDGTITTSAAHVGRLYVDKAGTVSAVRCLVYVGGTLASSETATVAMSVNGGAYVDVDTGLPMTAVYNPRPTTGLATAVSAGDYVSFRITAPTWATNPTSITMSVEVTFTY
jgi:hypothetical protein